MILGKTYVYGYIEEAFFYLDFLNILILIAYFVRSLTASEMCDSDPSIGKTVSEMSDSDPSIAYIPVHTSDSNTVDEPTCTFSSGLSPAGKHFFFCWHVR